MEQTKKNIEAFFALGRNKTFAIKDTCRTDNLGVLKLTSFDAVESLDHPMQKMVSFVPAAGASSRWIEPFSGLIQAILAKSHLDVVTALKTLLSLDPDTLPLPTSLSKYFAHIKTDLDLADAARFILKDAATFLSAVEGPKALYPATVEGDSFLAFKIMENATLDCIQGEVYICPDGRKGSFEQELVELAKSVTRSGEQIVIEQNDDLATLRFGRDLNPALDDHGKPSKVAGGHGALLQLIPNVKRTFTKCHSIFIRNIDNVIGISDESVAKTNDFLRFHQNFFALIEAMRDACRRDDLNKVARLAEQYCHGITSKASGGDRALQTIEFWITYFLKNVLHVPDFVSEPVSTNSLLKILNRPCVTMGMVPNGGKDIGGTPVFAEVDGRLQKLCLEVPHATLDDRERYLTNPNLATHFNPVFCCVELFDRDTLETWSDHPFWLVAEKKWRGRPVWYQESILYEMIGSSAYTNLVFVEIPRRLFNPHKSLLDARHRTRAYWQGP